MPPRGVKKGTKRAPQYERIKDSVEERGGSENEAEEIAARTVNKERARAGEARESSELSRTDISSSRRGGLRSHRKGPRGRTRDQLYVEAKKRKIHGRSRMTKAELQHARCEREGIAGLSDESERDQRMHQPPHAGARQLRSLRNIAETEATLVAERRDDQQALRKGFDEGVAAVRPF